MAWDSKRPVPWKRLGKLFGIYLVLLLAITMVTNQDRSLSELLPGIIAGVSIAAIVMVITVKFGYTMPLLRSREENAAARAKQVAARQAARAARSGGAEPEVVVSSSRPKAAPTSRTSTGPSQHPRRTTKTRKR